LLANLKLISPELHKTWIPSVGEWMLVYGDKNYEPRFTCHVTERKIVKSQTFLQGINALQLAEHIDLTILDLEKFEVKFGEEAAIQVTGDSLIEMYMEKSLIASGKPKWKGINSNASSHYHVLQQRMNLIGGVTDVDLMKFNLGKKNMFFELKRSYIEPENWMPFKADAGGYKLLAKFAEKNNGELFVVYWKRQQNPWLEDLSKIKILKYSNDTFQFLEYLNFSNFAEKYLSN